MNEQFLIVCIISFFIYSIYVSVLYRKMFDKNQKFIIENTKLKNIANKNIEDKDRLLNDKYKSD